MDTMRPSLKQRTSAPHLPHTAAAPSQGPRVACEALRLFDSAAPGAGSARAWAANAQRTRPYLLLGGAAVVGYIAAGGITAKLTRVALRHAGRIILSHLIGVLYVAVTDLGQGGGA